MFEGDNTARISLKRVTAAAPTTTRGKRQGNPLASGLHPREVKGLSYFGEEAQSGSFHTGAVVVYSYGKDTLPGFPR